jgi:hypothetical protein
MRKYGLFIGLTILLVGIIVTLNLGKIPQKKKLSNKHSVAYQYLYKKGYNIVFELGVVEKYTLKKSTISKAPYNRYWSLQDKSPSNYFGKTVSIEKFIVNTHPLSPGKVIVYVYLIDHKVVGGTSILDDSSVGVGFCSIEGKTAEKLQDTSPQEWRTKLIDSYSYKLNDKKRKDLVRLVWPNLQNEKISGVFIYFNGVQNAVYESKDFNIIFTDINQLSKNPIENTEQVDGFTYVLNIETESGQSHSFIYRGKKVDYVKVENGQMVDSSAYAANGSEIDNIKLIFEGLFYVD